MNWSEIDLSGEPSFLAGWRLSNKRLDAYRVDVHEDVHEVFRDLCWPALDAVANRDELPFEPYRQCEPEEEFLACDISELPRTAVTKAPEMAEPGSVGADTADLVRLVRGVHGLAPMNRDNLEEGGYKFYGICWPHGDTTIGFITKVNPMKTLAPGFRYFQFGATLRRAETPDIALREGADLVVGTDSIAILSEFAFQSLLGDTNAMFQAVPGDVSRVRAGLRSSVPLTSSAARALQNRVGNKVSLVRRLRLLPDRITAISPVDVKVLKRALKRHDIEVSKLINGAGEFDFDESEVEVFLDLMEGRYFEDDLSGDRRRADRFSKR